jgi:four helix bundle protein
MRLKSHKDLIVYKSAIQLALRIHELSKNFPAEERYSLTDQIRRSSRSIAANIAEAFRKMRYPKVFISKLSD